ncbi:MAG: hypothetical protein HF978_08110 [Desulfobacteraceae bacterium]|nr:hypothetical protein [Desulfobacteraceae bacterium]MBC2755493.1 hypothetical protein [Desulfobacteraceae bacterium]
MNIFSHTSQNKKKLRRLGNIDLFRTVCLVLTGFLLLQVISPGAAFCLKEGNRVIQCRSLWSSPPPPVVDEIAEADCCNKKCKEKSPADSQNHSSSSENEKGSCCISLVVEHEGVVCLPFSDFHVLEIVTFWDLIEPFITSNGFPLNSVTEKPPSLVSLRSVVLIL